MPNLIPSSPRDLPDVLLDDLRELLTQDNNGTLTWVSSRPAVVDGQSRWFSVSLTSDGKRFGLRLDFWIPDWMPERGLQSVLPAHLEVSDFFAGREASVELGSARWSALEAGLPKVARTCARLINELWGRTESDEVLLKVIELQPLVLDVPFSQLPGYGR